MSYMLSVLKEYQHFQTSPDQPGETAAIREKRSYEKYADSVLTEAARMAREGKGRINIANTLGVPDTTLRGWFEGRIKRFSDLTKWTDHDIQNNASAKAKNDNRG